MASANYFSLWDVDQLKAAIFNAYQQTGAGTQACLQLNQSLQGMTATEVYSMCESLDNMGMIRNSLNQLYPTAVSGTMGSALKVESSFATAGEAAAIEAAQVVNSNTTAAAARTAAVNVPVDYAAAQGGGITVSAGAKTAGGVTKATALGNAVQAVVAAGIGVSIGVWLDGALYNANPEFWDSHNLSEVNPETWAGTTIGEGLLKFANYPYTPVLMDDDGQMYANQEYFALVAQYMAMQGLFDTSEGEVEPSAGQVSNLIYPDAYTYPLLCKKDVPVYFQWNDEVWECVVTQSTKPVYISFIKRESDGFVELIVCSENDCTLHINKVGQSYIATHLSGPFYRGSGADQKSFYALTYTTPGATPPFYNMVPLLDSDITKDISYLLIYGDYTSITREGAHIYDQVPTGITPDMSIDDVLDALEDQYPDIFDKKLKLGNLQPDGTITNDYYLPIGWPDGGTDTQPTSKPENNDVVDPKNEGQAKRVTETQKPTDTTGNEDNKGTGSSPAYVAPTGTAEALYAIYNPTVQQVKDLGAWLWSSAFIDQILKMFSNPMEAIISLHKIYGTPTTAAQPQNIKVGYLDSGVSSKVVTEQYITIDCGQVKLNEVYGSVFDYSPYTEASLYLPFIGIVQVDIADVMRGRVNVIYHIDVITGAVLAEVKVLRDGSAGGVIYQYTGSCAEHYPLSAGSYMGIVTGAAGITAGVVGTVMSGGALAPMLLGGAASIGAMHTNVQKSGSFSSNAGAMGIKKPYFILSRPQSAMAEQFQHYTGYGANTYCTLASVQGYARVKYIHLDNIQGATAEDLDYIDGILKRGVLNG